MYLSMGVYLILSADTLLSVTNLFSNQKLSPKVVKYAFYHARLGFSPATSGRGGAEPCVGRCKHAAANPS